MAKKGGLGKGLDAIFYDNAREDDAGAVELSINDLEPNRTQPRQSFDDGAMTELADSIAQHGVLQPILVRPLLSGGYQIVAGERRWRASRMAGLTTVPAVIRDLTDSEVMQLALIENLQREDLKPLEEANGYKMLMDNFQVPIYNYIRRLVVSHEDAEDVLQEVFIRVYRNLDQFRGESSLSTWIYRIATNESLRLLNTRKDEEAIPAEEVQEELIGKLKASDYIDYENELAVKFQEAILSLPEKQRLIFNLRYYDELDYEEISRILDSKVDTLKVNYHYAKEKIKEYILNR